MSAERFIRRALEHLPALLRAGRLLTGRDADAEDLAQETLARALEHRAELRDETRLKPWLLAVQRNLHLNSTRGLRPRLEVLDGGLSRGEAPEPASPHVLPDAGGLDDELEAALASLSPEWREALWLREVEELSYEEIARIQQCPLGTVRSRLARARLALAEKLAERGEVAHGRMR